MCIYLYICVYIHIYMCIYLYPHIYIYICGYRYIYMCIYTYIYMCIYICVYIHIYMCIYLYTHIHIYICVYIYIYCICIHIYMCISTYIYRYRHIMFSPLEGDSRDHFMKFPPQKPLQYSALPVSTSVSEMEAHSSPRLGPLTAGRRRASLHVLWTASRRRAGSQGGGVGLDAREETLWKRHAALPPLLFFTAEEERCLSRAVEVDQSILTASQLERPVDQGWNSPAPSGSLTS